MNLGSRIICPTKRSGRRGKRQARIIDDNKGRDAKDASEKASKRPRLTRQMHRYYPSGSTATPISVGLPPSRRFGAAASALVCLHSFASRRRLFQTGVCFCLHSWLSFVLTRVRPCASNLSSRRLEASLSARLVCTLCLSSPPRPGLEASCGARTLLCAPISHDCTAPCARHPPQQVFMYHTVPAYASSMDAFALCMIHGLP